MEDTRLGNQNYNEEYTDPLYGNYQINEPFASSLKHRALQEQIERLEGIKSLGLAYRFFPAANHTKWEHYLGMFVIAKTIKQGLTQQEQEQLQWLCLLRGLGHLPCTYVTAAAVFLATTLSNEFKKSLKAFISPANKICRTCKEPDYCFSEPLIGVFEDLNYQSLRGALSAYKILSLPEKIHLGHRDKLIQGIVCPKDKLFRICNAISRYDYLQRDAYHTGIARFGINNYEVFKALNKGIDMLETSPSMRLLDEFYDYLVNSVYLRPDIACCESLLAKVLAVKLCDREIDLSKLIEYDDRSLMSKLQDVLGESPISYALRKPPIYHMRSDVSIDWFEAPNPIGLERELLGIKSSEREKLQNYPDSYGVILSIYHMWDDPLDTSNYRVILNILQGCSKIYPLVATAFRLQNRLGREEPEGGWELPQNILSFTFGRKRIVYDDSRVRSGLLKMADYIEESEANSAIWEVYDTLSNYAIYEDIPPLAKRFWRMLRHPSRSKRRLLSNKDVKIFWERMIPCLMSLASNPNAFNKSWMPILERLRGIVHNASNGYAEFVEALAYSTELVSTRKGRPKWVFPSVKLLMNGASRDSGKKNTQNEVDVVTIELLKDKVQIKLTECTKSASDTKATEDHRKLERLKNILESQRFEDLEVLIEVISSSKVGKDFISPDRLYSRSRS